MESFIQQHKMKLGIAALIAMIIIIFTLMTKGDAEEEPLPVVSETPSTEEVKEPPPKEIKVDVKGAVKYSGVYPAQADDRIIDVINLAQPVKNADLDAVNLAGSVKDQLVIYVPFKGEVKEDKYAMYQGGAGTSAEGEKVVRINDAAAEELQQLPGIGPKKAEDIINYREQHGGFKSKEELKEIKGIGEKTYMTLEPFVEL